MRNYKNRIIVFKEARLLSHLQHVIRAGEILTGVKFNYHNAGKYASTKSLWKGDGKEQYQEPDHKLKIKKYVNDKMCHFVLWAWTNHFKITPAIRQCIKCTKPFSGKDLLLYVAVSSAIILSNIFMFGWDCLCVLCYNKGSSYVTKTQKSDIIEL